MINSTDPDQKPTDLDLRCLLRQGMSISAREGLRLSCFVSCQPKKRKKGRKSILYHTVVYFISSFVVSFQ